MKKDDVDIEKLLKKFEREPGESVRQAVMSEFNRETGLNTKSRFSDRFWGKPVPAYAVIVMMLIFVTGAFLAGRQMAGERGALAVQEETMPGLDVTTAEDIPWSTTAKDLL